MNIGKERILSIKKIKKQVKGITLVALVVTIIVLLILAGVAITLSIGQNGIFSRAQGAASTWKNAETNEQLAMQEFTDRIDGVTRVDEVPIPAGFYYAGGSKETGLVISDSSLDAKTFEETAKTNSVPSTLQGNQFVWVPVETPTEYFIEEETTLSTATGEENKVKTNVYSKLKVRTDDQSTFTAGAPGETYKVREPDILNNYDTDEEYYKTILNFDGTIEMAESFVAEYKAMADSIKKYNGFYIGRYEITANGEKKGESLTNTNWYNLYKACQNVVQDETGIVKSTMIYGMQWDAACSWLSQKGYTDENSNTWGNYSDSTGNAKIEEKSGFKQDTGFSEYWKANNIYDLAGNCYEWTQEAYLSGSRVFRRRLQRLFGRWISGIRS